jgi:hypothetical protein
MAQWNGLPIRYRDKVKTGIKNKLNRLIISRPKTPSTVTTPIHAPNKKAMEEFFENDSEVDDGMESYYVPIIPEADDGKIDSIDIATDRVVELEERYDLQDVSHQECGNYIRKQQTMLDSQDEESNPDDCLDVECLSVVEDSEHGDAADRSNNKDIEEELELDEAEIF